MRNLSFNSAKEFCDGNDAFAMYRESHYVFDAKNHKKPYCLARSRRVYCEKELRAFWLSPIVSKKGNMLYHVEACLRYVPPLDNEDYAANDWNVVTVKRW